MGRVPDRDRGGTPGHADFGDGVRDNAVIDALYASRGDRVDGSPVVLPVGTDMSGSGPP